MLIPVALITFGGGRQLSINIREPSALMRGAGLHRLTFPVELDARNTIGGGVPVTLSGYAWLTMSGMDWLRSWATERPIVSQEGMTFDAVAVLALSDEVAAVAGRLLCLETTLYAPEGGRPAGTARVGERVRSLQPGGRGPAADAAVSHHQRPVAGAGTAARGATCAWKSR
jgi:hypothetical protein